MPREPRAEVRERERTYCTSYSTVPLPVLYCGVYTVPYSTVLLSVGDQVIREKNRQAGAPKALAEALLFLSPVINLRINY